jgi:hypothetical protein
LSDAVDGERAWLLAENRFAHIGCRYRVIDAVGDLADLAAGRIELGDDG